MARRRGSPRLRRARPTSCCVRWRAMPCGTTSPARRSTSRWAGPRPRRISPNSCGLPSPSLMKTSTPWPSHPRSLRNWQLDRLRRYLRTTVLPFSAHYGRMFAREHLAVEMLRSPEDLQRIPFTSKHDFLPGSDGSDPVRDFVLVPDRAVLARRPTTVLRALLRGRAAVAAGFEREFRPLLLTSTTGRSSEPVPFVYTAQDIENLKVAGARVYPLC